MKLECLPRRETQGGGRKFLGEFVQNEPLLGSRSASRQTHAKHKAKGFFLAGLLQSRALVAMVLQIKPMELGELAVALGNGARRLVSKILGDGSAQEAGSGLDAFVGTMRFDGFGISAQRQFGR